VQRVAASLKRSLTEMLSAYTSSCSSSCRCAVDASDLLRMTQQRQVFQSEPHWATALAILSQQLPAFAAKLLDPAAGHKFLAVRDALQVFTE
jgi:hypothetical protein